MICKLYTYLELLTQKKHMNQMFLEDYQKFKVDIKLKSLSVRTFRWVMDL